MTTDRKKFMEAIDLIEQYFLYHYEFVSEDDYTVDTDRFNLFLIQIKELFLKHYNISEDEILKLAQAIKIKREKK